MKPACRGNPGGALRPSPARRACHGTPRGPQRATEFPQRDGATSARAGHAHRRRAPTSRPALRERAGAPRRALPGPRAWGSQARRARGPGCVGPARGPGGASRAAESRRGRAGLLGEGRRRAVGGRKHGVAAARAGAGGTHRRKSVRTQPPRLPSHVARAASRGDEGGSGPRAGLRLMRSALRGGPARPADPAPPARVWNETSARPAHADPQPGPALPPGSWGGS